MGGNATYEYGSQSCSCDPGAAGGCFTCASNLVAYCGGASSNLDSGTNGATCTATFSGAQNGAIACAVAFQSNLAGWTLSIAPSASGALGTTGYMWSGFVASLLNSPATGTVASSQVNNESTALVDSNSSTTYAQSIGGVPTTGTASITITSIGAALTGKSGSLYINAHGTVSATTAIVSDAGIGPGPNAGENLSITF
jgi:hypothetical protein